MDAPIDREMLRALVREILRDLAGAGGGAGGASTPSPRTETVSIENDAELAAFVQRLLRLFEDAQAREDLRAGRYVFRLDRRASAPAQQPAEPMPERIDAGVLSEAKVVALAASRRRVVLGKRVAVTPLARDKARELGLKLERER